MKKQVLMIGVLALVSCAKDKPYKEVYKQDVIEKLDMCSDADPCVYLPTVGNTPKDVTASRPYWQGKRKMVKFELTSDELLVKEVVKDKQFGGNSNNSNPVLSLGVTHLDYKCKEDTNGDCSNEEQENTELEWQDKRFIKIDKSKFKTLETNLLPVQLSNLFSSCYSEINSEMTDVGIEDDAMNIVVKKTYKASAGCAGIQTVDDLGRLTFSVDYNYSIVKLSSLADKNYEKVNYPYKDQSTFGFFTTEKKNLGVDNSTNLDSLETMMNRWSPNKKDVVYYLNEDFYKPEMKVILDSTVAAIKTVNSSLKKADAGIQIKLEKGEGKKIGDLRNNFIVLVSDPQASGVIGYGPSHTNPDTGEILNATTVMYYGTIKKFLKYTYNEIREQSMVGNDLVRKAKTVSQSQIHQTLSKELQDKMNVMKAYEKQAQVKLPPAHVGHNHAEIDLTQEMLSGIKSEVFSLSRVHKAANLEDQIEEMSRHNVFHGDMFNFTGAVMKGLNVTKSSELKPWDDLTKAEQEKMIEKLLPLVWIPTLVHEFGHNLGLRHNFNGSEDAPNYYSRSEMRSLGMNSGAKATYSSIMDYNYSNLNTLPVMGKYDVAALRFAYAREVEDTSGKMIAVDENITKTIQKSGAALKEYKYCTDEHVYVNPTCNRHDEGETLEDIVDHYIADYEKSYYKRYMRNNRESFGARGDAGQLMRVSGTLHTMRLVMEITDRIISTYNIPLSNEVWTTNEFLKGLKSATEKSFNFMNELVKTPGVQCVVSTKKSITEAAAKTEETGEYVMPEIAGIAPLEDLTDAGLISCLAKDDSGNFKLQLKDGYQVYGQFGKHFNHMKSPELRGDLSADPTEVSVKGIWIDKLVALKYLTQREMGLSTIDGTSNTFLDIDPFRGELLDTITGLMVNKSNTNIKLQTIDGNSFKVPFTVDLSQSHEIAKSFHPGVNKFLGIKNARTQFKVAAMNKIKGSILSSEADFTQMLIHESLNVKRLSGFNGRLEHYNVIEFVEPQTNSVIESFIFKPVNSVATYIKSQKDTVDVLKQIPEDVLKAIVALKKAGEPLPETEGQEIPEVIKKVHAEMDVKIIESYMAGEMMTQKQMLETLRALDL